MSEGIGVKIIFAFLVLILTGCLREEFSGIVPNPYPAPEFTLTNQLGERVSLSDLRGRIVAMSFVYTSCTAVCPVTIGKFTAAARSMGAAAGKEVIFVGVTVDPDRDTPERTRKYVEERGLAGKMHYLTGERSELEMVWSYYNVYVNRSDDASGNYAVDHTSIIYLIDKKGNVRLLYPGTEWKPESLVRDARALSGEGGFLHGLLYYRPLSSRNILKRSEPSALKQQKIINTGGNEYLLSFSAQPEEPKAGSPFKLKIEVLDVRTYARPDVTTYTPSKHLTYNVQIYVGEKNVFADSLHSMEGAEYNQEITLSAGEYILKLRIDQGMGEKTLALYRDEFAFFVK